ncbi:zinc finger MYM-type protein 5-like [Hydra vulgaris]|uniref:zinc finger MYM-type protein 5-like n=1 Tax=Hydra vulgaris TaxID=6087 RepID=UPI001F5F4795|nr:zinc finger MYM-type protein 5-like [Hydra vulgaris]
MKPSKSGATKRKEAAATKDAISKLPKVTSFFTPIPSNCTSNEKICSNEVVIHEQLDIANNQPNTIEKLYTLPLPPFSSVACDLASWPEQISDAQRCDLVKRGPQQVDIDFPYNIAARRRFSTVHYKLVMNNGETVPRSWLVYSVKSDKIFCFCCKLFETNESPFCSGTSTWEGLSKKLKDHETGTSHQKCFRQWMQLKEGINNDSSIDKQEMQLFLKERQFWRDVLERLIDIIKFLSEKNLAFRGSD